MPSKLRPYRMRRKKRRLRLRPKLPPLWQSQKKVRPVMLMRKMLGSRIQVAMRRRTAQPALRIQQARRNRNAIKRISDLVSV